VGDGSLKAFMKRELKKRIKEDEIVTGVEHAAAWVRAHAAEVRIGLGVTAALAAVIGTGVYLQSNRRQAAEAAFAAALETFDAPVAAELPAGEPRPPGPVFATAEEKLRKAAAAFDGVERRYPTLPQGQWAGYYSAVARMKMGDRAEAEKALKEIVKSQAGGGLAPGLARMALANLQRLSGALDKAAESYRSIADDTSFALPRDYVLMNLASTLEDAHRLDEAQAAYQRVADEFPDGVYASEARRRADYLKPAARS
jgi:tetratricopeptide (TPR) repeat protein